MYMNPQCFSKMYCYIFICLVNLKIFSSLIPVRLWRCQKFMYKECKCTSCFCVLIESVLKEYIFKMQRWCVEICIKLLTMFIISLNVLFNKMKFMHFCFHVVTELFAFLAFMTLNSNDIHTHTHFFFNLQINKV